MCQYGNAYCRAWQRAGLELDEAARQLGVSAADLEAFELGEREPDAVVPRRMALLYRVSADELLGE